MIELPEAKTIARDLRREIPGKTIAEVGGNFTDHRFTFYGGDPDEYDRLLSGRMVTDIIDRNVYVEIEVEDYALTMRDGANISFCGPDSKLPGKSKLLLQFADGSFINVTVSMYAFIGVRNRHNPIDNEYYSHDVNGIGALDEAFSFAYFSGLINDVTRKLSAKAFLATEQRFVGIGNGVCQDILFNARINPRQKMNSLSEVQIEGLYNSVRSTLTAMVEQGGRDTEKNIYGVPGGYRTIMSSKTYRTGCPVCKSEIVKEQYLGGSVYYCPHCQPRP